MNPLQKYYDIVVIGAGPSGSVVSALLNKKGYRVLVLEREHFPRFSIGESLLPQSMEFLKQADMLSAVEEASFQFKNGAAFSYCDMYEAFDFREKFSKGIGTTFQVQRDRFDKILADEAQKQGVEVCYGQLVSECQFLSGKATLTMLNEEGEIYTVSSRFVLDASGFGRVLPRLLNLDQPSNLDSRTSIFTHIQDNINDCKYDRNKILITVHPVHKDVWYWLIPFSNGRASVGVVAPGKIIADLQGDNESKLLTLIYHSGLLATFLKNAEYDSRVGMIEGYSCDVKKLYGSGFALLGNAGEFLDPVFSSGVTIALKSAILAADIVDRQLAGLHPDWDAEFADPLRQGVNIFREFVLGWYDGCLQNVIFSKSKDVDVKRMISSILAGYVWDEENPYVKEPSKLSVLEQLCSIQ